MRKLLLSLAILFLAIPAYCQTTGYVVKVTSATVYLDIIASSGISLGQNFVVFTEGEELKHPVTGASLGRIENEVAKGHIDQIMDKYSIGKLDGDHPSAAAGQKVRMLSTFTQSPAQMQLAPTTAAPSSFTQVSASPLAPSIGATVPTTTSAALQQGVLWRSPPIDMDAVDFAMGDITGDGKPEIILADASHVYAYSQVGDWKPQAQYTVPGAGSKIVSVDAADLRKSGRADVFVTYYDAIFEHVQTLVLEFKDGNFTKETTLPYMVRSFQDASGDTKFATQQLVDDKTFPFGNIYLLDYKDGKYTTGPQIKFKRLEWLYGFVLAKDSPSGQPFPIFVTSSNNLKAQFKNRAWVSEDDYAQTANRLTWQEREHPLMFYPRLVMIQKNGILDGLYAIENVPSLGSLGGAFGYYRDAKLQYLRWDGLGFKRQWSTDSLGGYATDVAVIPSSDGKTGELWTAIVASEGRTSVLKLQP